VGPRDHAKCAHGAKQCLWPTHLEEGRPIHALAAEGGKDAGRIDLVCVCLCVSVCVCVCLCVFIYQDQALEEVRISLCCFDSKECTQRVGHNCRLGFRGHVLAS
jgi:hypothetical protein